MPSKALTFFVKVPWIVFKRGLNRVIVEDDQYQKILLADK